MAAMYEISSDMRFASSLLYIKRRVSAVGGECEIAVNDTRSTLIISIDKVTPNILRQVISAIIDTLSDIIVTDCKTYYINEHIGLPIQSGVLRSAFTSALSAFDRDTDKIIAKTLIKLTQQFNLDSFFEFRLDTLKTRWDEVCLLANENIAYLVCQKTFMELLRFLISNIDGLSDEAHIVKRGDKLEVLGVDLSPIENIYINESLPSEIQVVNKLVAIAPKRIFLHIENPTLAVELKDLFGTCTVVN